MTSIITDIETVFEDGVKDIENVVETGVKLALTLCAALSLGACAVPQLSPQTANSVQVYLADGQLVADAGYNVASHWYNANQATLSPTVKATLKADLKLVYDCSSPTTCAGYLKDLHDAVTDGNLAAQGQYTALIANVLADAQKAGLAVTIPTGAPQ